MDSLPFIQENITKSDSFHDSWTELYNLYTKKLWHQLTLHIEKMLMISEFRKTNDLRRFYEQLISTFENKMNSLALARISIIINEQIMENEGPVLAIEYFNKMLTKINGINSKEASILIMTQIGLIHLNSKKDLVATREIIEKTETLLNEVDGVTSAHAPFYQLSSSYYSVKADYSAYYREALKYLSCLDEEQMDSLSRTEKEEWALKLCVSALLGRDIFNFGELLMHSIIEFVPATHAFMLDLVRAFNEGSFSKVEALERQLMTQPDLVKNVDFLKEKLILMALVEMIFQRPINQRTVKFTDVSLVTRVDLADVQIVVMKAMSKGLIRGRIDEVNETIMIKWVQPRVLNHSQIESVQRNIKEWMDSAFTMSGLINQNASEILS